jgi:hypothetical protein
VRPIPTRAAAGLTDHGQPTLELLETAWRVACRVLDRVARATSARLDTDPPAGASEAGRSRDAR